MHNILFFFNADGGGVRGGSESILRQIYKYYSGKEYQTYVLFVAQKTFGGWDGIDNEKLHLYYGGGLFALIKNLWKLRGIEFDYSFSTFTNLTGLLGFLKRIRFLKINCLIGRESTNVFDWYKGFKLLVKKIAYRFGYPAVDILICQTYYMKKRLLINLPWIERKTKILVIPNPIDLGFANKQANERIDTSIYNPYIVTAGRCVGEKAYDILLKSFYLLHKKWKDFKLVLLGDGPLLSSLKQLSIELDLQDDVFFLGYTENVFPYLKNAQLCVISSRLEGFPNVLLQMMSQNEKVVTTLCAGGIDSIKGLFTCPTENVEALANTIEECLLTDTRENRATYDAELESRSIEAFMKKLLENCNNS